jgi:bacterioferritin-associated ferredoxin
MSLCHSVTQEQIETVVANWLRAKIAELEGQTAENIGRKTAVNS